MIDANDIFFESLGLKEKGGVLVRRRLHEGKAMKVAELGSLSLESCEGAGGRAYVARVR